ncbi:ADP-ribose pyrophosphatase protein [Halorhabdus tiamatea SARL4B]|uniref:ADP-ribose pyrophosphatase protein n=1 Tax=Halorhabdus tiamatea SARL4B TaxID=1033806 RepID=F7PI63_9EURY|nr:NUDIX hydrolase [Halorhabdus tiamatea]ERJ05236.1 ADP-ribose pyrophosphatase protein [Halorhabdus tiamatea SARL4B]CCQ32192.1 MutT/NUDIX family protein [Halorhabdus tiamatea SARL4B]
METTRHFVATVYVVHDGETALHDHEKLDMWLPPGGHIDRDELPHVAAKRETREELGLDVDLFAPQENISSSTVESIPQPQHFLLEDINVHDGQVGHQHVDFIFYGELEGRELDPADGEAPADAWEWFSPADLQAASDRLPRDVIEIGERAIEAFEKD